MVKKDYYLNIDKPLKSFDITAYSGDKKLLKFGSLLSYRKQGSYNHSSARFLTFSGGSVAHVALLFQNENPQFVKKIQRFFM